MCPRAHAVSCGTEADNWAIWGVCMHARKARGPGFVPHVVSTAIEHPAVIAFLEEVPLVPRRRGCMHLRIQGCI